MKIKYLLLLFILAVALHSCDTINPEEPIPTYIQIDSMYVEETDPVVTGSTSSRIDAGWVYFNNQPVGVFTFPATIPVIAENAGLVTIMPGVMRDGLAGSMLAYPYYMGDTFTLAPAPGEVIHHQGKTRYFTDTRFVWREDFETGNSFVKYSQLLDETTVDRISDDPKVIEGKASGYIELNEATPYAESVSNETFVLTTESYIEIDYKCSVPFTVGLQAIGVDNTSFNYYIAGMKPRETQNKFYISLQETLGELQTGRYRVAIKAALPEGQSAGYIVIDNIKVVTF